MITRQIFLIFLGLTIGATGQSPPVEKGERPRERPSRAAEEIVNAQEREGAEREAAVQLEVEAAAEQARADSEAQRPPPASRPVFTVSGSDAWAVAARAGWKFFPHGAAGPRDGNGSFVQLHPGVKTSVVSGPHMVQARTHGTWTVKSENVFYMFADARGAPRALAPGWRLRDLQVRGVNWQWVSAPQRGSTTPFVSLRLVGLRSTSDSFAEIVSLTLEGPPGRRDWRAAFAQAE